MGGRTPRSLRRQLVMLGACLALVVVTGLAALLANQRKVESLVDEGLAATVPEVLERQRAAANLERLIRFGWIVITAAEPSDWRPASMAAQALAYHPSFAKDEALRREVQAVYAMVRRVGQMRDQAWGLRHSGDLVKAVAIEEEARRLWAPQEAVLVRLQDGLASDVGRLTVERFSAISATAETVKVTGVALAGIVLLALLLTGWIIHRNLLWPVLKVSRAMRVTLERPEAEILLPPPGSREIAILQDATFRLRDALRQAAEREAALRASEQRLSTIFSASEAAIALADADGRMLQVNEAFHRMLGYAPGELVGVNYRAVTYPEDAVRQTELTRALFDGKIDRYRLDKRYRRKDGALVWADMAVKVIRRPDGSPDLLVGVAIDVTERTRAQRELLFTQAMVDQSRDPIYCLAPDEGFRNVYVNTATCRHFGRTREELLAMRVIDWDPLVTEKKLRELLHALRQCKTRTIETVHRVAGGLEIPVEVSANYLIHDGREYVAGHIRDIRERKRWMEDIERSNEDLRQFAYVASHDLQEPLRQVASFLQLLERRYAGQLDQAAREYIGYAVDGAVRMKRLIEDLLEFSRVDRLARPAAAVGMDKVVAEAVAVLNGRIRETHAEVTVVEPLPRVLGDTQQLVRVMQNLLGNALKYRHPDRPPRVRVTARSGEPGHCVIAVSDNGIGIAPEYHERIFLIFQRLHGLGQYEGTGIGLAICKRIVERHGGRLWVESEEGEGSTFLFSLPVARD